MAHFVQGEVEPWRWQVHAFQAAGVPPIQEAALARNVEGISRIAGNVTLHPEAAGTQSGTAVINSYGVSKFDVSISDVQTLLLPGPDAPARHHSWWRTHLGGCHLPGGCDAAASPAPSPAPSPVPAAYAERHELQVLDFSVWLRGHAEERDHVVLTLALGEGRDFELLAAMLREGALLLVDKVYVHWHYQLAMWHQLATWEFIFSLLNISFEYID